MRIAFFLDQLFWRDGKVLYTDESYVLFPASFASEIEEITLVGRVAREPLRAPYALSDPAINLCALPDYSGLRQLWRTSPRVYGQICEIVRLHAAKWDAIVISGPNPIGHLVARQCLATRVPVALLVRQNLVQWQRVAYRGLSRFAAVGLARALEWDFKRLARARTVFTVGKEMEDEYRRFTSRVHSHLPCLVSTSQFRMLSALSGDPEATRLLYVGRLSPEKGIQFLLNALATLRVTGKICHLDIAGSGSLDNELKDRVAALGLENQVNFLGYVPYGPTLFDLYERAGALVVPSLTEGFPQVVTEALCVGLPVIATTVGGIPSFLADGQTALLVPPADSAALARAIARLVVDKGLRQRLLNNGRALMQENTLEVSRDRFICTLREEVVVEKM